MVALIRDLSNRLNMLADNFGQLGAPAADADDDQTPIPFNAIATRILAQRRLRAQYFDGDLFHEPAWDMLLILFLARDDPAPIHVKTLVGLSEAPATTAQRWIEHLDQIGLVARKTDAADRRRIEVTLSRDGRERMEAYLKVVAKPAP